MKRKKPDWFLRILLIAAAILVIIAIVDLVSSIDWTTSAGNVTISDPSNDTAYFDLNTSYQFNGSISTTGSLLANYSLYHNFNGTWLLNQTQTFSVGVPTPLNETSGFVFDGETTASKKGVRFNSTSDLRIRAIYGIQDGSGALRNLTDVNITTYCPTNNYCGTVLAHANIEPMSTGGSPPFKAVFSTPLEISKGTTYEIIAYNETGTGDADVQSDGDGLATPLQIGNITLIEEATTGATGWFLTGIEIGSPTSSAVNFSFNSSIQFGNNLSWNIYACAVDNTCGFAQNGNFTVHKELFLEKESYDNTALETSDQNFNLTMLVSADYDLATGVFNYNNTEYSPVTKTSVGTNFTISKTHQLPQVPIGSGSYNHSFFWDLNFSFVSNGTIRSISTPAQQQNTTELIFNLCGVGGADESVLNFTLKDQYNGSIVHATTNATTFQATFNLGVDSANLNKNFSIDNQSMATSEFDFCTSDTTNVFYADMEAFITAVDFSDTNYFLNNATLDGSLTSEIDIWLLRDSDATLFYITVEQDNIALPGATVQIAKYFVEEGAYKTVEIDETDSSGRITAYLELDKDYRFTITKNNEALGILERSAICEAAPCEMILSVITGSANVFSDFDAAYADNVLYNLSYNPLTKIIEFQFVDITGLATSFNMETLRLMPNQSAILVNNQTVYTSSGTLTFNMTGQPNGNYRVNTYVSRSPPVYIFSIDINISEVAEALGLTGVLVALIIIIALVFGIALSPAVIAVGIPIALTIVTLMGFLKFNWITLTIIWILGLIVLWGVSR